MKKVTEKWVKQQVVKTLKSLGAYYFYPVANGGLAFIIDEHNYNHLEGYIWDNIPAKK